MRAMDVMTTPVITVTPTRQCRIWRNSFQKKASVGCRWSKAATALSGSSAKAICCTAPKPAPSGGCKGAVRGGSTRSPPKKKQRAIMSRSMAGGLRDIMSTEVITVPDTADLADVAMLLETKRIKRVPVTHDGKLVGIISRANLVRALATTSSAPAIVADADDRSIREQLLSELRGQRWANIWAADIMVRDRVVHIWMSDDQPEAEKQALRIAAENISGVRRVEEHIVPAPVIPAF